MTIARLVLHDAIRRHLTQLERLRCVRRVSVMRCGSDLWGEHDGATWAHLVGE